MFNEEEGQEGKVGKAGKEGMEGIEGISCLKSQVSSLKSQTIDSQFQIHPNIPAFLTIISAKIPGHYPIPV